MRILVNMPVPERLAYGQSQMLSHNIILHIVLGAGDPENAALGKPPEVFEVDIRLVKDDISPSLIPTQSAGAAAES